MSDDVKPYTREELPLRRAMLKDRLNGLVIAARDNPPEVDGFYDVVMAEVDRLLATARAGLDAQERLSKDHNPFSLEALDAENERLRADSQRLNWLSQHITNIDWMQYQNGDDIRQIIDTRSGQHSSPGEKV